MVAIGETSTPLKLYNWNEYISAETLSAFIKETGYKVELTEFNDEDDRDQKLVQDGLEQFDLVMMDHTTLHLMAKEGQFRQLPDNVNSDQIHGKWSEECGRYGVPYAWGTMGIAYRSSATDKQITSWQDLLLPEFNQQLIMHFDEIETTSIALIAVGKSYDSDKPSDIQPAVEFLKQVKSQLMAMVYGLNNAAFLGKNTSATMMVIYSSDVETLKRFTGFDDWHYVVPKEGSLLWVDCFAVPQSRELHPATIPFLKFINRPEIAAKNAEEILFATTNTPAFALTSKDYQGNKELFPEEDIIKRSYNFKNIDKRSFSIREQFIQRVKKHNIF